MKELKESDKICLTHLSTLRRREISKLAVFTLALTISEIRSLAFIKRQTSSFSLSSIHYSPPTASNFIPPPCSCESILLVFPSKSIQRARKSGRRRDSALVKSSLAGESKEAVGKGGGGRVYVSQHVNFE
jgi:hypothetical protein